MYFDDSSDVPSFDRQSLSPSTRATQGFTSEQTRPAVYRHTIQDYLDPTKVSQDVLKVIQSRMAPSANRTVSDLRKLYGTLPGRDLVMPVADSTRHSLLPNEVSM